MNYDNRPTAYYILDFYLKNLKLDKEFLHKLYDNMSQKPPYGEYIGPFESIEILHHYCFNLCAHFNIPKVHLLQKDEYCSLIENITNINEFKDQVHHFGNCLANPYYKKKKRYPFQNLFH